MFLFIVNIPANKVRIAAEDVEETKEGTEQKEAPTISKVPAGAGEEQYNFSENWYDVETQVRLLLNSRAIKSIIRGPRWLRSQQPAEDWTIMFRVWTQRDVEGTASVAHSKIFTSCKGSSLFGASH